MHAQWYPNTSHGPQSTPAHLQHADSSPSWYSFLFGHSSKITFYSQQQPTSYWKHDSKAQVSNYPPDIFSQNTQQLLILIFKTNLAGLSHFLISVNDNVLSRNVNSKSQWYLALLLTENNHLSIRITSSTSVASTINPTTPSTLY